MTTYTVLVGHTPHAVEFDEDGICWLEDPPPTCPQCQASLGAFCDDTTQRASDRARYAGDWRVGCDGCTWTAPITETRS